MIALCEPRASLWLMRSNGGGQISGAFKQSVETPPAWIAKKEVSHTFCATHGQHGFTARQRISAAARSGGWQMADMAHALSQICAGWILGAATRRGWDFTMSRRSSARPNRAAPQAAGLRVIK